jgi:iron(III) transport system permease protein
MAMSDVLADRLRAWPRQMRRLIARDADPATVVIHIAVLAIVALVVLPVVTILVLSATSDWRAWPHLLQSVLPKALVGTVLLLGGMAAVTSIVGTATAWLVTMYRFPGREMADRLLVLPLAIPTYIVAYAYVELLDYAGPVQSALRGLLGVSSPRDYWFPDVRSTGGAVLVLSAVLYPYVYLTARASFVQQSVCALEVARTLGRTPLGVLFDVALPLARPAIAAGTALVMMEGLNDLGAVQHLGVETLSAAIYTTWLQRGSLGGALQIAAFLVVVVLALVAFERAQRSGRYHNTTGRFRAIPFQDLDGWRGWAALAACLVPVGLGFAVPIAVLIANAWSAGSAAFGDGFWIAARNSVLLSAAAAVFAVAAATLIAYAERTVGSLAIRRAARVAGLGYALPGTLLALGLMVPLAAFDNALDGVLRRNLGFGIGLLLSGSLVALGLAFVIRFLAVALGAVESGLSRVSPNLDAAARTLGAGSLETLVRVHLPMLVPSLGAAALLVFVDGMKELPATLLLRPFNFNTLATEVYNLTALEQTEMAAVGALAIVLVGLLPVLLLHRAVAGGRSGS